MHHAAMLRWPPIARAGTFNWDREVDNPTLPNFSLKPREGKANSAGVHLYNLREDLGEKTNLADRHPEKLRELLADWERINAGMIAPLWLDGPAERGTAENSGQKKSPE